jgi:leader peptidase (prepilin peptidase)/N-methyltransferase
VPVQRVQRHSSFGLLTAIEPGIAALFGATIGSFLNVVIYRLPRGESIVKPRSRCPECGHQLSALDNIPVLSWLILRGRCRSCGVRISPRYPLVELLTAVVWILIVVVRDVDWELALWLPFSAALVALTFIDLDHQILPNKILLPLAIWGVIVAPLVALDDLPGRLIAAAGAFLFLLIAALAYPGGMGMGDVKLAGVMGLYLGPSVIPALFLAFLSGSAVGIAVMVREGTGARKRKVPFGPFLALGAVVAILAGPDLIDLYRDNFL